MRCKYCNRTGHAFGECYRKPPDPVDGKDSKDSKDPKSTKDSKKPSPKKSPPKKKDKKDNKKNKKDNQGRRVDSDAEEQNSELESPAEDGNQSNRLTFPGIDTANISSTVRRLAELERQHVAMGDLPSCSNDTPSFMGTISKTRTGNGRGKEEKAVLDSGCTVAIIPLSIVKDHNLVVSPVDKDEPGMRGFGDHNAMFLLLDKPLSGTRLGDLPGRNLFVHWSLTLNPGKFLSLGSSC